MKAILRLVTPIGVFYTLEQVAGRPLTIADLKFKFVADQTIGHPLIGETEWQQRAQVHIANGDIIPDQLFPEDTLVIDAENGTVVISNRWENKDALVEFATWRFNNDTHDIPDPISHEIIDIPDTP